MNISKDRGKELTGFQEAAPFHPSIDLATDFVMPYGVGEDVCERIEKWRQRGYIVHLTTGVAWGNYQDFLFGEYDGVNHEDLGQREHDGRGISHGKHIPYMVPSIEFADYLSQKLKRAVDSGVVAIHLEEPEFWVRGGYSEGFKREWELYYKEPWQPPHSSPDAQFRASKLKAFLYTRAIDRICSYLKSYAKLKYGLNIRFYIPTHSLINYATWNIVSPESNLIDLSSVDGYIAQIWTGTSRTANSYEGVTKERTFETAYLEYGIMQELTRGTGRRMWFLHDPIEDNARYTWENYRYNYFKTLIASLLHPDVHHYEIAPWPNRIYNGKYPRRSEDAKPIPKSYATELNIIGNALRDMNQKDVSFKDNNSRNVGVLIADSSMYQRLDFSKDINNGELTDDFSVFYGLTLPLLKHGLPIRPVQLDNIRRFPSYLDDYRMLIFSYEFMKPEYPDIHNALAQWVRDGGILIYAGDGKDPYNTVKAWWNQGVKKYDNPSQHLFESLGINTSNEKIRGKISGSKLGDLDSLNCMFYKVGRGFFVNINENPSAFSRSAEMADLFRKAVRKTISRSKAKDIVWKPVNRFILERGPYVIGAVMDESVNSKTCRVDGLFVDLLDHRLPVRKRVLLRPDENCLLYDITKAPEGMDIYPLAGASRVELPEEGEIEGAGFNDKYNLAFAARGPLGVSSVIRFKYKQKPEKCILLRKGKTKDVKMTFHEESGTFLIKFNNDPDGLFIIFK